MVRICRLRNSIRESGEAGNGDTLIIRDSEVFPGAEGLKSLPHFEKVELGEAGKGDTLIIRNGEVFPGTEGLKSLPHSEKVGGTLVPS